MKRIFSITLLAIASIIVTSCQKSNIGYLLTEDAGYSIDSLVVKKQLDDRAPTEVPNPTYQNLRNLGMTHEAILALGISPTIRQNPGVDYDRSRLGIPWTSTAIEGMQGTMPIQISVHQITTDAGDVVKLRNHLQIRNNGMLSVPVVNDIPIGRYRLSFTFTNEGHTKKRENIFTIIVK